MLFFFCYIIGLGFLMYYKDHPLVCSLLHLQSIHHLLYPCSFRPLLSLPHASFAHCLLPPSSFLPFHLRLSTSSFSFHPLPFPLLRLLGLVSFSLCRCLPLFEVCLLLHLPHEIWLTLAACPAGVNT